MPNPLEYVVTGALMQCNQGTIPAPFSGLINQKVKVSGVLVTTEMDKAPFVNIPPFGICSILTKTNPVPCAPAPLMWQDTYDTKVLKQKTLIYKSCINCAIGGKLSFITSGQVPLPEEEQERLIALHGEKEEDKNWWDRAKENLSWWDAVELIPVVGSVVGIVRSAAAGEWGWVAANVGFLALDVAGIFTGGTTAAAATSMKMAGRAAKVGAKVAKATKAVKAGVKAGAKGLKAGVKFSKAGAKAFAKAAAKSVDNIAMKTGKICVFACFPAGTPVSTREGLRPIEDIQVGDWVYAYNEQTGEIGLRRVINTMQKEVDVMVEISLGKEKIRATPEHPFYVNGKWVDASSLKVGDKLTTKVANQEKALVGELYPINSLASTHKIDHQEVQKIELNLNQKEKVFNFEVEGWHTYFAGKFMALVHNAGKICEKVAKKTVGWLRFHEGLELGHTIAKHVGKTDAQLISRLNSSSRIRGASTFSSQSVAESVISATFKHGSNRTKLKAWLRSGSTRNLVLDLGEQGTVIGRGIMRGQNTVSNLTKARVILKSNGKGGFNILTAFPTR